MKTKFRISILLITLLGLMSATSDSWAQKSHAHEVTFTPEKLIVPAEGGTFKIQMKAIGYLGLLRPTLLGDVSGAAKQ